MKEPKNIIKCKGKIGYYRCRTRIIQINASVKEMIIDVDVLENMQIHRFGLKLSKIGDTLRKKGTLGKNYNLAYCLMTV